MESRVVVVGAGWAGIGAAVAAAKGGSRVTLLEKNDRLMGYGLVGGEIYQKGRLTICLEAQAMGAKEIFAAVEGTIRHRQVPVPGQEDTVIYDVLSIEQAVAGLLSQLDVQVRTEARFRNLTAIDGSIDAIVLDSGEQVAGDAYVDASGSAGPASLCTKHGWGCVSCINRCRVFGDRVSLVDKAGIEEKAGIREDGRLGGSGQGVNILKDSLDRGLVRELEAKGVLLIPVPATFSEQSLELPKSNSDGLRENLVIVDNGFAKCKSRPFIPLAGLRSLPGFQRAAYFDPAGGSKGNCIRFLAVAPRDNSLRVKGIRNLFVAGEKQGMLVGHCEALVSGLVAGLNAHRFSQGGDPVTFPRDTAIGEMLAFSGEALQQPEGYKQRYSCSGGPLWKALQQKGLYCRDMPEVQKRMAGLGLSNIL